jgi:hypothetical protein
MNNVTSLREYRQDDEQVRAYIRARMAGATAAQGFTPLDAEALLRQAKPKTSRLQLIAVAACFAIVGALGALVVGLLATPNQTVTPIGPTITAVPAPIETPTATGALPIGEWVKLDVPSGDKAQYAHAVWVGDSYLVFAGTNEKLAEVELFSTAAYRYYPDTNTWKQIDDLPAVARYHNSYALDGDQLYLLMAVADGMAEKLVIYQLDLSKNDWAEIPLPDQPFAEWLEMTTFYLDCAEGKLLFASSVFLGSGRDGTRGETVLYQGDTDGNWTQLPDPGLEGQLRAFWLQDSTGEWRFSVLDEGYDNSDNEDDWYIYGPGQVWSKVEQFPAGFGGNVKYDDHHRVVLDFGWGDGRITFTRSTLVVDGADFRFDKVSVTRDQDAEPRPDDRFFLPLSSVFLDLASGREWTSPSSDSDEPVSPPLYDDWTLGEDLLPRNSLGNTTRIVPGWLEQVGNGFYIYRFR